MKHWRILAWKQVKGTQQVTGATGSRRTLAVGRLERGVMDCWTGDFTCFISLSQTDCCRLKVDENAPSLPSRSLKRGRGRGSSSAGRQEGNSISNRGRGGSRSRGGEKEGKAIKADLVTKQARRFRPRTAGSNLLSRQRTNNKLNVVSGKSEERIEPEKAVRAEKLKKSR